jgi:hypothetical protein
VLQKLMRYGDIKTTMAYDANVDAAAEEAVRARQRNSSRNSPAESAPGAGGNLEATSDATLPRFQNKPA